MADVTKKLKLFLFISILSLLINVSICIIVFTNDSSVTLKSGETLTDIQKESKNMNVTAGTIGNLAIASGTSFVPYFDLINIITLHIDNIPIFLLVYSIITGILGTIKLFMLVAVIANFIPFFNV